MPSRRRRLGTSRSHSRQVAAVACPQFPVQRPLRTEWPLTSTQAHVAVVRTTSEGAQRMSGGGGDGTSNFPGGDPWLGAPDGRGSSAVSSGQEACEALEFDARLRNVDPGELGHLSVDDVLTVAYQDQPARMVAVFRELPGGKLADTPVGALLDRLQELLPCLGILPFEAVVTHLDGGNTRVHVQPRSA